MKIGQMEKVPFGSENLGKLQGILCEGLAISKKEQQISQSYQALRGSENVKNFCTQTFQLLVKTAKWGPAFLKSHFIILIGVRSSEASDFTKCVSELIISSIFD